MDIYEEQLILDEILELRDQNASLKNELVDIINRYNRLVILFEEAKSRLYMLEFGI